MRKTFTQVFGLFAFLLMFNNQLSAQVSAFTLTIANDVQVSDRILEFDLYLLDTDPLQTFELAAVQAGILVNPAIYNSGTITVSVISGSSQLSNTSQHPTSVVWDQATNAIKLTPKPAPGAGNGSILSSSTPGTRLCRLRITNSIAFTISSTADLTFNFSTSPYPTKVSQYISGNNTVLTCDASNCFSNAVNVVLNPPVLPPVAYNVTGGGSYCQGTAGVPVGLSGSQSGVVYTLIMGGVDQSPAVAGTGLAISFENQQAGNYTVRGNNSGGSTAMTGSVTITENSLPATPTITPGGPTTFCSGGSVTLTSSAGVGYTWSNGSTTQAIAASTAGSYTVRVRDANSCFSNASAPVTVTVDALPATPTISPSGPIALCSGQSTSLTSSTANSYLWSTTATSSSINVSSAGSYTVRVRDANGCQSLASAAVSVTVNPLPSAPTITPGGPSTFCSGENVVLTASNSAGYLWSTNATSQSISVSSGGSYAVQAVSANGCYSIASAPVTVTVNALPATPVITPSGPLSFCSGGTVSLSATSATGYTWSTGETTRIIAVNTSGSYTVRVSNANGCLSAASAAAVVTINSLPATPTVTAGGPTTFCSGGSVTLTSSAGNSYEWSTGAVSSSITVNNTGSYSVAVTNSYGCQSANSSPISITVNPNPGSPQIGIITSPTCYNPLGKVSLSGLPSVGNWTINPGGFSGTGLNYTVSNLFSGTYTFTVTNANGCTSAQSAAAVVPAQPEIPSVPVVGLITPPNCTVATGSVIITGLPNQGIWTLTRWAGAFTTTGTGQSDTLVGLNPGTYNFNVTTDANCTSGLSANVVIPDRPSIPTAPVQTVDCSLGFGEAVVTVTSPVGGGLTYAIDGGLFGTSTTFTGVDNGSHTISVKNSAGCVSTGLVFNVSCDCVNGPVLSLSSASDTACGLSAFTLPGNTFGGKATAVTFSENGAGSLSATSAGSTPFSFTYTPAAGDIGKTVLITVTTNNPTGPPCSAATEVFTLSVLASPSVPIIEGITQPSCTTPTGSIQFSGLPASGNWTLTRTPGDVKLPGNGSAVNVTGIPAGIFSFTVTNAAGCTSQPVAGISIKAAPATPPAPVLGLITQPVCEITQGSVVLNNLPDSGTWTINPGAITGTGASTTITDLDQGTYRFSVMNVFGCISGNSSDVIINPHSPIPILIINDPMLCYPAPADLTDTSVTSGSTADLNYSYWTNAEATIPLPGPEETDEGVYYIKGTTSTGCFDIEPVTVTITMPPQADGGDGGNECDLSFQLGANPSIGTGTWSLQSGPGTGTFTPSVNNADALVTINEYGSYVFRWTEVNGYCSSYSDIPVLFLQMPEANAGHDTTGCGLNLNLNAVLSSGTGMWNKCEGPGNISFNSGTQDPGCEISASVYGDYILSWTEANGICIAHDTVLIEFREAPQSNPGSGFEICDSASVLGAVPSVGIGEWTSLSGPGIVTFSDPNLPQSGAIVSKYGKYTLAWTETNGVCSSTDTINAVFTRMPVAEAGSHDSICGLLSGLSAVRSVGKGLWTLSSGPGSVSFNPAADSANVFISVNNYGVYTFKWEESNRICLASDTVQITFIDLPTADADTGGEVCGLEYQLTANPNDGTGFWSVNDGPGNVVFSPDQNAEDPFVKVDTSGVYSFIWTETYALCSSSDTVEVLFHRTPGIEMVEDRMICIGDSVQLSFTGSGTFIWGPDSLLDNSSIVEPYAKPGESMYFTLTLTDDIGCFSKDSVFVDVFLPPVAYAGIDTVLNYDFDVLLSATLMASEQGEWTVESGSGKFDDIRLPGARVSSLSTGENRFKWSVDNGVCPVVSDEVIVFVNDLLIPTLITPNNDNRNDYFVLKGLENLGKTELVIFDKNGIMMFKTNNYNNDWNGVDSDGNPLQEDTYYFIIRSENGHSASGYLVIRR